MSRAAGALTHSTPAADIGIDFLAGGTRPCSPPAKSSSSEHEVVVLGKSSKSKQAQTTQVAHVDEVRVVDDWGEHLARVIDAMGLPKSRPSTSIWKAWQRMRSTLGYVCSVRLTTG